MLLIQAQHMTIKTHYYVKNNGVDQFQIAVPKELRHFFGHKPFIRHNLTGEGGSMIAEIHTHH